VDDLALLWRSRRHPEVLGELYERHAAAVFRYLTRRVGPAVAEDLLSEVFTAAISARLRFRPHASGSALPWLYGIAANAVRSALRARPGLVLADPDGTVDWDAVDARLDARAQRDALRAALAVLTPADRELLLLVAWEGLSPAEAGAALGLTPEAARSRLHRARGRARDALAAPHLEDV
jgi:RNA polymerase sigma-70 factor (ECF subfamily)